MSKDTVIVMNPESIRLNWDQIKNDPYNNRPDIKTPDEYIEQIKLGLVHSGGVKVILSEPMEL